MSIILKMTITRVTIFISCVLFVSAVDIPSTFTICKKNDPDYSACVVKAATIGVLALADGDKSLGIQSIDPLKIDHVHIPGNGGSVDLEQTYKDISIVGLKESKFTKAELKVDGSDCSMHFESHSPKIEMTGDYKAEGKMLLFTLNGFGWHNLTIINFIVKHDLTCEKYEKKGKEHIKIKSYVVDFDAEKLHYDYKNLVNGNAELSAEVLKVMNENDLEIFREVRKDYQLTFGEIFKQISNKLFSKVPAEQFFS